MMKKGSFLEGKEKSVEMRIHRKVFNFKPIPKKEILNNDLSRLRKKIKAKIKIKSPIRCHL